MPTTHCQLPIAHCQLYSHLKQKFNYLWYVLVINDFICTKSLSELEELSQKEARKVNGGLPFAIAVGAFAATVGVFIQLAEELLKEIGGGNSFLSQSF